MSDYRDIHNISFTAYALLRSLGYDIYNSASDVEDVLTRLVGNIREDTYSVRSGGLCVYPTEEDIHVSVEVGLVRRD